jgi:PTS system D-glucosamine-specific IIC component
VEEEVKLYTRADYNTKREKKAQSKQDEPKADTKVSGSLAELIVESLGGAGNIKNLDSCATRLRVTVADPALVSEAGLKKGGALGVIVKGDGVQVIYGPRVTVIKSEVEEWLGNH